jgi:hypothetical protein
MPNRNSNVNEWLRFVQTRGFNCTNVTDVESYGYVFQFPTQGAADEFAKACLALGITRSDGRSKKQCLDLKPGGLHGECISIDQQYKGGEAIGDPRNQLDLLANLGVADNIMQVFTQYMSLMYASSAKDLSLDTE